MSGNIFAPLAPNQQYGKASYQRYAKPPYSYSAMIILAIENSPEKKLTLSEIHQALGDMFRFFREGSYIGWKDSVRHNLSQTKCFKKILKDPSKKNGKGNYWIVEPSLVPSDIFKRQETAISRGGNWAMDLHQQLGRPPMALPAQSEHLPVLPQVEQPSSSQASMLNRNLEPVTDIGSLDNRQVQALPRRSVKRKATNDDKENHDTTYGSEMEERTKRHTLPFSIATILRLRSRINAQINFVRDSQAANNVSKQINFHDNRLNNTVSNYQNDSRNHDHGGHFVQPSILPESVPPMAPVSQVSRQLSPSSTLVDTRRYLYHADSNSPISSPEMDQSGSQVPCTRYDNTSFPYESSRMPFHHHTAQVSGHPHQTTSSRLVGYLPSFETIAQPYFNFPMNDAHVPRPDQSLTSANQDLPDSTTHDFPTQYGPAYQGSSYLTSQNIPYMCKENEVKSSNVCRALSYSSSPERALSTDGHFPNTNYYYTSDSSSSPELYYGGHQVAHTGTHSTSSTSTPWSLHDFTGSQISHVWN